MITFKKLLTESRQQSITKERILSNIPRVAKQWLSDTIRNPDITQIFRGLNTDNEEYEEMPYGYIDPMDVERWTEGKVYNDFFASSPAWKDYPDRKHSVIGATSIKVAEGYGNVYVLIPFDGCMFGVSPTSDIFDAFNEYMDIQDFFKVLCNIYTVHTGVQAFGERWEEIVEKVLPWWDKNDQQIKSGILKIEINHQWFSEYMQWFSEYMRSRLVLSKWIYSFITPKRFGFSVRDFSILPNGREVWTDGKCMLVRLDQYLKEIKPALLAINQQP